MTALVDFERALSLLQPYASLIVVDPKVCPRKVVENRPRMIFHPPPGGVWVGVHASKGWYADRWGDNDAIAWMDRMTKVFPGWSRLIVTAPRGALLGVMHVVGARVFEDEPPRASIRMASIEAEGSPELVDAAVQVATAAMEPRSPSPRPRTAAELAEETLGPQAFGPVCYLLDDARALPEPIPCKGALGLWRVPPEHVPALRALVVP